MLKKSRDGLGGHRRGGRDDTFSARGMHSGRTFGHGRLRFVILQLIAEKPAHGYELIKAIEDKTGGAYVPSPGVIYPTLTLLEELGHIEVTEDDSNRKLYNITTAGKKFLTANKGIIAELSTQIGGRGLHHRGKLSPSIVRAMENLKTALRLRISQGELAAKEIDAIANVLDAAARQVESV